MNNLANEHDGRVCAVNQLALKALQHEDFIPYEEAANSRVQKVSEVLRFCSLLNDTFSSEHDATLPVHENVCKVCQLADAVSSIADVLIGKGLDEVLDELKEELRRRQDDYCHGSTEDVDETKAEAARSSVLTPTPAANELAIPRLYAHDEQRPSDPRRWTMDRKLLAERIPDSAAMIFAIGASSVIISMLAVLFTESIVPRIILALGLIMTAAGQNMGERAISDGQRR